MSRSARKPPRDRSAKSKHKPASRRAPVMGAEAAGPSTPFFSRTRILLLAILGLGFVLRVVRLMDNFPIVGDEGIYLRWAEIIDHQSQWFISLLDGKQPLPFWLLALQRFAWDGDPLFAARLLSVTAGLLTTLGLYALGKRLAGEGAGLVAALLYATLPWAIMYDRLAFVEALVNLSGVAIVYASIRCFDQPGGGYRRTLVAGLALGLGFFVKSTALLFAFFPALAGLWWRRDDLKALVRQLVVIYVVAAVFPLISWLGTPHVPTYETVDMVFHQTFFFATPEELRENPFVVATVNFPRFLEYVPYYLTWPALLGALAALAYLTWKREWNVWLVFSVALLPLLVQIFILKQMFPTRYPFPHIWPFLLLIGFGVQRLWEHARQRWNPRRAAQFATAAVLLAAGPMLLQSTAIVVDPKESISPHDSGYFLGTYAHAGFGVREAIDFLIAESQRGPFVLLVDPIWSVPADAMFPYLNYRYGIRVYEAWWTQLSGTAPIFPRGTVELIKSQYERVKAGSLDLTQLDRVYYLTDTNYYTPEAVEIRQPDARLLRRFPKPGGEYFVDVYRLK